MIDMTIDAEKNSHKHKQVDSFVHLKEQFSHSNQDSLQILLAIILMNPIFAPVFFTRTYNLHSNVRELRNKFTQKNLVKVQLLLTLCDSQSHSKHRFHVQHLDEEAARWLMRQGLCLVVSVDRVIRHQRIPLHRNDHHLQPLLLHNNTFAASEQVKGSLTSSLPRDSHVPLTRQSDSILTHRLRALTCGKRRSQARQSGS